MVLEEIMHLSQKNGSIEFKGITENLLHINVLSHNQFLELPGNRLTSAYYDDPKGYSNTHEFQSKKWMENFLRLILFTNVIMRL